ncbi:MAG: hypothetical protein ABR610_11895 [Thermoanaerobaculia bacterium]
MILPPSCRRGILLIFVLAVAPLLASSCGKKGDPSPPFPRGPRAITDLAIEQEGADAVLTFTYPDRLMSGLPLTDLASIEVYRLINPSPSLTAPRRPGPTGSGAARGDLAPAAGTRQAAVNARIAEQNFYRDAERIATLPVAEIARRTRGASIVFDDPLPPLFARKPAPSAVAYAVVSVRRDGDRSPLSNLVTMAPEVPPGPPVILAVTPEDGRVCLEWLAPTRDLLGREPVAVGGYFVYRRSLPDDEYAAPLNAAPITGTGFVDAAPPYGALVYTLRATVPGKPKIEGAAAVEAALDYRDVFPPPPPPRLDALPETGLVRLVWDPVGAPDLAGYAVFRSENGAPPVRMNAELTVDSFFNDTKVAAGHRYVYTVKSLDRAGNASAPSPAAVAEPL